MNWYQRLALEIVEDYESDPDWDDDEVKDKRKDANRVRTSEGLIRFLIGLAWDFQQARFWLRVVSRRRTNRVPRNIVDNIDDDLGWAADSFDT